jgi:hypothetical protein
MSGPFQGQYGNPDWLRSTGFSGGVLVDQLAGSTNGTDTYGPFYVGDAQSLGIQFEQSTSQQWSLEVDFSPNNTFSAGTITSIYKAPQEATLLDFIENVAPFVRFKVTDITAVGPPFLYTFLAWKSQTDAVTVVPSARGVICEMSAATVVAGGTQILNASAIVPGPAFVSWDTGAAGLVVQVVETKHGGYGSLLFEQTTTTEQLGGGQPFNATQNQVALRFVNPTAGNIAVNDACIIAGYR